MRPQGLSTLLLWAAQMGWYSMVAAADPEKTTTTPQPCTATSSTSDSFYDLRPAIAVAVDEGAKKKKGIRTTDYTARGHDYGSNFTMNICAAVVEPVKEIEGVSDKLAANVSAYYEKSGKIYSLGTQSSVLISRGRELVLQYKDGSPCPAPSESKKRGAPIHDGAAYKHHSYADDEDEDSAYSKGEAVSAAAAKEPERRKSATFAFLCDRDPTSPEAVVSFVGTPDECAYFFKVRSLHACAGVEPHKPGSVGPGGVFAIILFVALLVYFVGGVFYQRTVTHARGWRQLPNYSLWAGIWSFLRDILIILTSSCARFLPSRRGYRTLSNSPNGRGRNRDDENRLIDQLDEEWDD